MFDVNKSYNDVIKMECQLELLRSRGYTKNVIEEILNNILPSNYNIDIIINDFGKKPAIFDCCSNKIQISLDGLRDYLNKLIYKVKFLDKKELFDFYVIFTLVHEVEHLHQYLVGEKYVYFPHDIVCQAYKNIFNLIISETLPFIYGMIFILNFEKHRNCYDFLLERNANVEAYSVLCDISKYEGKSDYLKFFKVQLQRYLQIGYRGIYNGSIEETYHKIWKGSLYNSFSKNEIIPVEDRVRYGLPIDISVRKQVLKKEFEI